MRRREFIAVAGAAAAWPIAARAQQRRVIVLTNVTANDPEGQGNLKAIADELESLGWKPGQNLAIDFRATADEVIE